MMPGMGGYPLPGTVCADYRTYSTLINETLADVAAKLGLVGGTNSLALANAHTFEVLLSERGVKVSAVSSPV